MKEQQKIQAEELADDSADAAKDQKPGWFQKSWSPVRTALLRGLAVVLPPLLTIIFFFWAWNTIDRAVIKPAKAVAAGLIVWSIDDSMTDETVQANIGDQDGQITEIESRQAYVQDDGAIFRKIGNDWVPDSICTFNIQNPAEQPLVGAHDSYLNYVNQKFLSTPLLIPAVLALFIGFLYLTGKLLAAGIGRIFWKFFESMIDRLPIIRNVYSSVKQVTDFAFNDHEVQFSRVVAVEYPRKGIWSMGFVTGESMLEMRKAAGEPMLSVLMPTSPMPATGFTISVPKSQTIDLNITIDQAVQFCVSCGVVVPPHQLTQSAIEGRSRNVTPPAESVSADPDADDTDAPANN